MSHFFGGKYTYKWVYVVALVCLCVCVCVHTCSCTFSSVHFTSIKTYSPGHWEHVLLHILRSKQLTSELLELVSQEVGSGNEPHLSSRRVNSRKDKRWNQKYNHPPHWKVMLIHQFPLDILHALIYYIIILSVSLIFAHCTFKKMLGFYCNFFKTRCINQLWKSVLIAVWMCLIIVKYFFFF